MKAICGENCADCGYGKNVGCKGCTASGGCPFGKPCLVARYIQTGGMAAYNAFKAQLTEEFNALQIEGMPPIEELYPLCGAFVNLAYPLPSGYAIKLLDDSEIYLGTQVESLFNDGSMVRCFGLVAGLDFLLVAEYGENGKDPELVLFKKR